MSQPISKEEYKYDIDIEFFMLNSNALDIFSSNYLQSSKKGLLARKWLSRKFSQKDRKRLLICYNDVDTSPAQFFPFIFYGAELDRRFMVEVRCVNFREISGDLSSNGRHSKLIEAADIILLQPWFTVDKKILQITLENIKNINTNSSISFLDSYAHTDLRLASTINPYIDFYLKKSLFKESENYFKKFSNGTILEDYYNDLYSINSDRLDWNIPEDILPKLKLSPNFLTASRFINIFRSGRAPMMSERSFDIQARIGAKGTPWYQAMRNDALGKINNIQGITVSPKNKVSLANFMKELSASKLCFSPFGYGELCWRDIEAMATGAILIKPSMDHLITLPDLYQKGVTYLPCRWDFGDLEDVIYNALRNYEINFEISKNSYNKCADYINNSIFVDDMAFLFKEN